MGSVSHIGGNSIVNELQSATDGIEQAVGGMNYAQSNPLNDGVGQQGGGIQQELQQLAQDLQGLAQELGNGQNGGSQLSQGGIGQNPGGSQSGLGVEQNPGGGNVAQAMGSSGMNDLNNLITDAAHSGPGGKGTGDTAHVHSDLASLRSDVQNAADSGQMSEQTAAKALSDIGQGNVAAVEQDLTGTPGYESQQAQANDALSQMGL
jgi:hypothetical protein